jgi:hypothetical protein
VVEPQARFFARNRGLALLVRRGNPLGIQALIDVVRTGAGSPYRMRSRKQVLAPGTALRSAS